MSRAEQVLKQIKTLTSTTPDVEAAAVVDNDGLMIASALPSDADEDSLAAMSAAVLGIGERTTGELGRGDFEQVLIKGDNGYVVVTRAGDDAILVVTTAKGAKLGLIFLDVGRAAKEVGRLLG